MAKIWQKLRGTDKRPKPGERTQSQGGQRFGGLAIGPSSTKHEPPPAGTYDTYREMRKNPTVELARTLATAPIITSNIAVEDKDKAPAGAVDLVQAQLDDLWPRLVLDVVRALDYGWQSFEQVWEVREGKLVVDKFKALKPELTKILEVERSGAYAGLKQDKITLPPQNTFLYTYDGEAGNPYGRSRHESIREHAWHAWTETSKNAVRYGGKVAGVIPVMNYPPGVSKDASGADTNNYDLAVAMLRNLGEGHGVAMPKQFASWVDNIVDMVQSGADPDKLLSWTIDFLESRGQHGSDFVDMLRHRESLMLRGWLVPERGAIEGQHGTKADAEEHGGLALTVADITLQDILRYANDYWVNRLLLFNHGPNAVGTVRLTREGLAPEVQAFYRKIIGDVLVNPANVDLVLQWLDIDAMVDATGLPKAEDTIENEPGDEDESRRRPPPNDEGGNGEADEKAKAGQEKVAAAMRRILSAIHRDDR